MLRKMCVFGALVVVAVTFGANGAMAKPGHGNGKKSLDRGAQSQSQDPGTDGFSDGRV